MWLGGVSILSGTKWKWTPKQIERRKKQAEQTAKTPHSYARKKQIYEAITEDLPRY